MMGKNKGIKAKVLNVAPHIRFTHCVIHRGALAAKALQPELNDVLEMGSIHESFLFHSEVR